MAWSFSLLMIVSCWRNDTEERSHRDNFELAAVREVDWTHSEVHVDVSGGGSDGGTSPDKGAQVLMGTFATGARAAGSGAS